MKHRHYSLLIHPVFMISVFVLLFNDQYWKYEYHNWITGKLSDIAGLIVLPLFLTAFFPRHRKTCFIASAILFIVWKSPLSQPFIDILNKQNFPVSRVIDYTDLIALIVLPFAYRIHARKLYFPMRRLTIIVSGIISFITLCSTSMVRHLTDNRVNVNKNLRSTLSEEDIINAFRKKNMDIYKDTALYMKMYGNDLYLGIKDTSGIEKRVKLSDYSDLNLYRRSNPYFNSYTIPVLVLNTDTLQNVRIVINPANKRGRRTISIQSFEYEKLSRSIDHDLSKYQYEKKFKKPITRRIEEILIE